MTALVHVNACVPRGSSTAVIGPNGAGKTTLVQAFLGELPYKGRITAADKLRIGYVPQMLQFDRGLPLTVMEFLAMGIQRRPLWTGISPHVRNMAQELLCSVQAEHLAIRRLGALSGGELQRVLLALALAQNPELLILDEPAAGVDVHGEYLFCELLEDLRRQKGFTQLMVSHDLGMVTHHATHVICLNRTVVAQGCPKLVLGRSTLMTLFGLHMGLVAREAVAADVDCETVCCQTSHVHEGDDSGACS